MQFNVAGFRLVLESEYFHVTITFPAERVDRCPVFLIHAVGHVAGQDRSVASILAGQIMELIQLVDGA